MDLEIKGIFWLGHGPRSKKGVVVVSGLEALFKVLLHTTRSSCVQSGNLIQHQLNNTRTPEPFDPLLI